MLIPYHRIYRLHRVFMNTSIKRFTVDEVRDELKIDSWELFSRIYSFQYDNTSGVRCGVVVFVSTVDEKKKKLLYYCPL